MSYLKINPFKIIGQERGKRKYKMDNFFLPSFPVVKDGDSILFDAKNEDKFLKEVKIENKKRLEDWLLTQREENKPSSVKEVFVAQGSKEWLLLRKGLVTASKPCFDSKGLPLKTFNEYVNKKVADKFEAELMGEQLIEEEIEKEFKSKEMENGNELEKIAIERYEKLTGNSVVHKGFIKADNFGVSHDGITTDDDLNIINVEVKNLITNTYLSQILYGTATKKYYAQMQMQMYTIDCDMTHLVIQCQREKSLGVQMELLIVKVERDEEFIVNMINTLALFDDEFQKRYKVLKEKMVQDA